MAVKLLTTQAEAKGKAKSVGIEVKYLLPYRYRNYYCVDIALHFFEILAYIATL